MRSRVQFMIVSVVVCVALLLAPVGVVSGAFLSLSEDDKQSARNTLNSMFQVNTAPEGGGVGDAEEGDEGGIDNGGDPITSLPEENVSDDGLSDRQGSGSPSEVPEPGMLLLFGLGMLSLYLAIVRRRKTY